MGMLSPQHGELDSCKLQMNAAESQSSGSEVWLLLIRLGRLRARQPHREVLCVHAALHPVLQHCNRIVLLPALQLVAQPGGQVVVLHHKGHLMHKSPTAAASATQLYGLFAVHCTIGELDCELFAEEWPELQGPQQGALQWRPNTSGVTAKAAADLCLNCCLQLALELHQACPGLVGSICLCGLGTAASLTTTGPQGLGAAGLLVCHCWDIMLAAVHASSRGPAGLPMQAKHAVRGLSAAGLFAAGGLLTS